VLQKIKSSTRSVWCGLDLAKSEGKAYTFFQAQIQTTTGRIIFLEMPKSTEFMDT